MQTEQFDPVVKTELPVIAKIIQDETWLEGERRGCYVSHDDPVVRSTVCDVIIRVGAQMRENAMRKLAEQNRNVAA